MTLSSDVSPEMREYERFSTACANAYVQPLMGSYIGKLDSELKRAGFRCPLLADDLGRRHHHGRDRDPLSGAARRIRPRRRRHLRRRIATQHGLDHVLSFDMGGTTAKICLIDHAQPQTNRLFEVARIYRFAQGQRPAAAHSR